jgi:hypothetical protein
MRTFLVAHSSLLSKCGVKREQANSLTVTQVLNIWVQFQLLFNFVGLCQHSSKFELVSYPPATKSVSASTMARQ